VGAAAGYAAYGGNTSESESQLHTRRLSFRPFRATLERSALRQTA